MATALFLYHVVGDLTLGKPELVEFLESETVEAAIGAIARCSEGAIPVWRRRVEAPRQMQLSASQTPQPAEGPRGTRFVGFLSSLDVVAFLARVGDHGRALRTPVSEVVTPDCSLLKEVDPGTRLIDALEMMKQGVRSLLVRRSVTWKGMSKRFSVLYNGKWLKNHEALAAVAADSTSGRPSPPPFHDDSKFCCLSREDVVRFLIGRLGALAPLPLCSIDSLGAYSPHYAHVDASSLALECAQKASQDPNRVAAVVEIKADGTRRIIGEISAYKLQKCDYLAAAWAIRNRTAGQFVLGFEEGDGTTMGSVPDAAAPLQEGPGGAGLAPTARKFSSRSIGFVGGRVTPPAAGGPRSVYGGRSTPLLCKRTSSLAAVMAQMLSHRATHVWVVDPASDDALAGIVGYTDILNAVTRNRTSANSSSPREQL